MFLHTFCPAIPTSSFNYIQLYSIAFYTHIQLLFTHFSCSNKEELRQLNECNNDPVADANNAEKETAFNEHHASPSPPRTEIDECPLHDSNPPLFTSEQIENNFSPTMNLDLSSLNENSLETYEGYSITTVPTPQQTPQDERRMLTSEQIENNFSPTMNLDLSSLNENSLETYEGYSITTVPTPQQTPQDERRNDSKLVTGATCFSVTNNNTFSSNPCAHSPSTSLIGRASPDHVPVPTCSDIQNMEPNTFPEDVADRDTNGDIVTPTPLLPRCVQQRTGASNAADLRCDDTDQCHSPDNLPNGHVIPPHNNHRSFN